MHADDLADALMLLMERRSARDHVDVGTGEEVSIHALVLRVAPQLVAKGGSCATPTGSMARRAGG